jgi:adenylate cyclase class IV
MKIEYEVKYMGVDINDLRSNLKSAWWEQIRKRTFMRRVVFHSPIWNHSFLRVRDEWDKVTMTLKVVDSIDSVDWVRENEIEVNSFEAAKLLLQQLWFIQKAYQETYREVRSIDRAAVSIDERPWLKPFVEVEADDEIIVKNISDRLWFDYNKAVFWTVTDIYQLECWMKHDYINNLSQITFENPPKIF